MLTITLYTRPGCHLCEQARQLLQTATRGMAAHIVDVNIETDVRLEALYGTRIPVASVQGEDVLEWPFTLQQAQQALTQQFS